MKRYAVIIIIILLLTIITILENIERSPIFVNLIRSEPKVKLVDDVFINLNIEAKAVYVYDALTSKVIYSKNDNLPLPLASLTKLMTALVALESAPKDSTVTINVESINEIGDSGLFLGEKWKLENLAQFTLTSSSNDGAHAIATSIVPFLPNTQIGGYPFVDAMNRKAKSLNLISTHFFNETGLDVDSSLAGGYGSARDVTVLMVYLWKTFPELMQSTSQIEQSLSSQNETHNAINTNKYVNNIPGILLSKTGFTDISGGNLSIAFDAGLGHPIFITVLGSTFEGRFTDVQKLVILSMQSIKNNNFAK